MKKIKSCIKIWFTDFTYFGSIKNFSTTPLIHYSPFHPLSYFLHSAIVQYSCFLTLELWSPVAIGSKKQNDLRRVWQIQFDRFPHKTDFVFFLPMLCKKSVVRTTIIKVCWAKMVTWINIAGPIICVAIEEVWDLAHLTNPVFFSSQKTRQTLPTAKWTWGLSSFTKVIAFKRLQQISFRILTKLQLQKLDRQG